MIQESENYTRRHEGNGKYDIKDFLEMKNSELLKMNKGKKFDICLMNPPYGKKAKGINPYLHLDFTEKTLQLITDKLVCIMPHRIIYSTSDQYNNYKEKFDDSIINVEEINSEVFQDTNMLDIGIFTFDKNKNTDILIQYKNNNTEIIKSLFDISNLSSYEKELLNYIEALPNKINYNMFAPRGEYKNPNQKLNIYFNRWGKKLNNNAFLIASSANGAMNAKYFSGTNGKIFTDKNNLYNYLVLTKGATCNIMQFKSFNAATNCKIAMQNPLLRFGLLKLQDDQSMTARVYKYIPDINWEDSRVTTDEGLLEVCGCPKDKAKEYAEYCCKYMKEFDNE